MPEAQDIPPVSSKEAEEDKGKRRANAKVSLPRDRELLRPYRWQLIVAARFLALTDGVGLLYPLVIRSLLNTSLGRHHARLLKRTGVFPLAGFVLHAAL